MIQKIYNREINKTDKKVINISGRWNKFDQKIKEAKKK